MHNGSNPTPNRSALTGFAEGVEERLSSSTGGVWEIREPEQVEEEAPPERFTDPVWTPSGWMERERAVPDGNRKAFRWVSPSDVEPHTEPA